VGAAALGNLSGSLVAYGVGRVGRPSLDRARRAIERCDAIFARHGDRAVFLGRLLPLVRSFVSVPAGRAAVPLPRFLALTLAGCAIWSAAFILLGEWAGMPGRRPPGSPAAPRSWSAWRLAPSCFGGVGLGRELLRGAVLVPVQEGEDDP